MKIFVLILTVFCFSGLLKSVLAIPGCEISYGFNGKVVVCRNYTKNSCSLLRDQTAVYKVDISFNVLTNFDFSCLPTSTTKLYLYDNQIASISNCMSLKNLINLKEVDVSHIYNFDFSCLPSSIERLYLFNNIITSQTHFESLKEYENLRMVIFSDNRLGHFDFAWMPSSVEWLFVGNDQVSAFDGCMSLRALNRLRGLYFPFNSLVNFDLTCLPVSLEKLDLSHNRMSSFDLNQLSDFTNIEVAIHHNPINCNCTFFNDFVATLRAKRVKLKGVNYCERWDNCQYVTCDLNSQLLAYPWKSLDKAELINHDHNSQQCLS